MANKFLFQPISPFTIVQKFGEQMACVDKATYSKVIACDGNNPPPGYESLYGPKGHPGLDIPSKRWNPVYAAADGIVRKKITDPQRGLSIGIVHFEGGKYYMTRYLHLAAIDVDLGEEVKMGDFIGYADNTGYSSGDHLHFELGTCNQHGDLYETIDPLPHMYPTFALTAKTKIKWIREQLALIADKLADYARGRAE
jgi:murein DD-endopeptidase MepM/ murein hydrolase activator NlpD